MKTLRSIWYAVIAAAVLSPCLRIEADATLFWRYKTTGANAAWTYSGSTVNKAWLTNDAALEWQMVGSADFNRDGQPDILWRHSGTGAASIWYMNGSSRIGTNTFSNLPSDLQWQIQAVGDIDGDGYPDLVWRHTVLGLNAVWYLRDATVLNTVWIEPVLDLGWEIVGVGDFGSPGNNNPDGKLDLLWRHTIVPDGILAVWYMNLPASTNKIGSIVLSQVEPDQDWKVVGTGQLDGNGRPDIVWRHATQGLNAVWYMNGTNLVSAALLDPLYPLDWRLARQDYADSYWRLRRADLPKLSATTTVSPPRINLSFYLPTNSATLGVSLRRRVSGATNWSGLMISNQFVTNYTDTTVAVGTIYEYEFTATWCNTRPTPSGVTTLLARSRARPSRTAGG
jgi:hypothetical protein